MMLNFLEFLNISEQSSFKQQRKLLKTYKPAIKKTRKGAVIKDVMKNASNAHIVDSKPASDTSLDNNAAKIWDMIL